MELLHLSTADLALSDCVKVPIRACVLQQALLAARLIADELRRTYMLVDVGKAQLNVAPIEEALLVARSIRLERPRAMALASVAEGQAKLGQLADSADTFEEAHRIARSVFAGMPAYVPPSALSAIAHAEARTGRTAEALITARSIEDRQDRGLTLHFIAMIQAEAGRFAEAIGIARSIEDVHGQASAVQEIAKMEAQTGRITEALDIAPTIKDQRQRASLLEFIAEMQAKAGKIAEARQTVELIPDVWTRQRALLCIVTAEAEAGLTSEAVTTLSEAVAVARSIDGDWLRARAISSVAQTLAQIGMITEARETALTVMDAAERGRALVFIANEQIKSDKLAEASDTLNLALHSASAIELRSDFVNLLRTPLLVDIANAQVRAGLTKEALGTLERALRIPPSLKPEIDRPSALYFAQSCYGGDERPPTDKSPGIFVLDRDSGVVRSTVTNTRQLSCGIRAIGRMEAKAGQWQSAAALFSQALRSARSIGNDSLRDAAILDTLKAEATLGLTNYSATALDENLESACSIKEAAQRAEAFYTIAMALPK